MEEAQLISAVADWFEDENHDLCKGVFALHLKPSKPGPDGEPRPPKLAEVSPWKRGDEEVVQATPLGALYLLANDPHSPVVLRALARVYDALPEPRPRSVEQWADDPSITKKDVIDVFRRAK